MNNDKSHRNQVIPQLREKLHFIFDEMGGIDNQKSLAAKMSVAPSTLTSWINNNTMKSAHFTRLSEILVVDKDTLLSTCLEDFKTRARAELTVGSGIRWSKWLAKYPCDNRVILSRVQDYASEGIVGYRGLGLLPDRVGQRPSHFFINDRVRISVRRFRMPQEGLLTIESVLFLVKDVLGWRVIPLELDCRIDRERSSIVCPAPDAPPLYVQGEAGPQQIVCLAVDRALPVGITEPLSKGKIALASDRWVNWLQADQVSFRIAHSRYHVSYGQRQ